MHHMPCYRGPKKVSEPLAVEFQTARSPWVCWELNLGPLQKQLVLGCRYQHIWPQKRLSKVNFFVSSYKPNSLCKKVGDLGLEMKLNLRLIGSVHSTTESR